MRKIIVALVVLCSSVLLFSIVNAQQLVINEFLASNDTCCTDEFGGYDDWVEIYNAGSEAVDIGGMYITDDLAEATQWQIPTHLLDSTTIAPCGFLVLWCDKESEQGILHVEIKLSGDGEQIGLFASDGVTPIDTLTYGEQTADISYGRFPDGSDTWQLFTTPTPGISNTATGVSEEKRTLLIPDDYVLNQNYPNPFNPVTNISYRVPVQSQVKIVVYNLQGKEIKTVVNENRAAGSYFVQWNGLDNNGLHVASGIYLYQIEADNFKQAKKMILVR